MIHSSSVFCEAEAHQLGYLRLVLLFFQAAPGLRINIAKSEILPVGNVGDIEHLASFFGCKVASFPTTYLGLPLGASLKNLASWNPVVERFERGVEKAVVIERGKANSNQEHVVKFAYVLHVYLSHSIFRG